MAKKKSLSNIADEKCELQMTPMIDVTFLLLIFFLLTLSFRSFEGKLAAYLPKDVGLNSLPTTAPEKLVVTVEVVEVGRRISAADATMDWNGSGRFEFVGRQLAYRVGPRRVATLDEVQELLERVLAHDPEREIVLAPMAASVHADVIGLLDAARLAGVRNVTFRASRGR